MTDRIYLKNLFLQSAKDPNEIERKIRSFIIGPTRSRFSESKKYNLDLTYGTTLGLLTLASGEGMARMARSMAYSMCCLHRCSRRSSNIREAFPGREETLESILQRVNPIFVSCHQHPCRERHHEHIHEHAPAAS